MSVSHESDQSSLIPASVDLTDFTILDAETSGEVLAWRNHEAVRRWMLQSATITETEHRAFLQSLRSDRSKQYFKVSLKQEAIGVIDFYRIDRNSRSCYFGYYLKPDKIGSSLGVLLEFIVAEHALVGMELDQLIAETMPNNTAAMELHQSFGFEARGTNASALHESALTREIWNVRRHHFAPMTERLSS